MNNISFQGRTEFIINPGISRIIDKASQSSIAKLDKYSNSRIFLRRATAVKTDPEHLTVIMKNEKNGFLKFVPLKSNIEESLFDIQTKIETLKKTAKKENLTAWILGGTKVREEKGNRIIKVLNEIADILCDKKDIDTSILVGSNTGEETYLIRSGVKQLKLSLDKKLKPKANLEENLEDIFDIVELNKTNLSYTI